MGDRTGPGRRRLRHRGPRSTRLAAADLRRAFGFIGDFNDPSYSTPIVRDWNRKIKQADAYLVITPEYNHFRPGSFPKSPRRFRAAAAAVDEVEDEAM